MDVWAVIAGAVVLVALTLCLVIATVCIRMLREKPGKPVLADGSAALIAGSIGLFGVLVTGVFVITTFRIDESTDLIAAQAREMVWEVEAALGELRNVADETARLGERLDERLESLARRDVERAAGIETILVTSLRELELGQTVPLSLTEGETVPLIFDASQSGLYRLDVFGIDGFDSFLTLHEGPNEIDAIAASDDDGGDDLDSRIEIFLEAGPYRIVVEELYGLAGTCQVRVSMIDG